MRRIAIEKRIRQLQAQLIRLSMSADPSSAPRLRTLMKAIAIERRNLRLVMTS
ncbi:MAG: hypothetical protein QNJ40_07720 [Xanthomonadales bacterium]|nr:hypothetical protein [Xanthomonadales bacterium]